MINSFIHGNFLVFFQHLEWLVYVHTGNEPFAGTDSNVYITLINKDDKDTGEYQLTHANFQRDSNTLKLINLFERGARERFMIYTTSIGDINKIYVSTS